MLPIVAGLVALVCVCLRKWRIAAFAVFALAVESAAYRATTLVFHEHRPRVHRLENLPVERELPVRPHGRLDRGLRRPRAAPHLEDPDRGPFRAVAWSVAVAIPIYVALSRMYRGMHYPLDVTGGALVGIAALCVVVFAVPRGRRRGPAPASSRR